MKLGAKIFGLLSGLLVLFLLLGVLLPGTWRAEEEALLPVPPSAVFPVLEQLESWEGWTPFPDSGLEAFGPPGGEGAGLRWDDPQYGRGQVQITRVVRDQVVEYEVSIEGGALRVFGTLSLQPEGMGTRVSWIEEGDFGWSPLMGYAARGMASSQGEAMKASLARLAASLEGKGPGG